MSYNNAGTFLFQGLSSLGDKIQAAQEEQKNRSRAFKSLQQYANVALKIPTEHTDVMDLDSLEGLVKGKIYEEEQRRRDLQERMMNEQLQNYQQAREMHALQMAGMRQQQAEAEALGRFSRQFMGPAPESNQQFADMIDRYSLPTGMRAVGPGRMAAPETVDERVARSLRGNELAMA